MPLAGVESAQAAMKVIVVTGSSDGIGAEIARQLAHAHQAQLGLVLASRNLAALERVALELETTGAQVLAVPTDVSQPDQCRALIDKTIAQFGRLDVLINNAGISAHALFEEVRPHDLGWYEEIMRINFWGSVWCTHAALPHLRAVHGQIVAVSSLAGLVGVPGRTAYSASKFAMTGFFEALRAELKPSGVSVTLAFPGVVNTHIRYRGLNAQGQPAGNSGLKEDRAMSVQTCARLIIAGMQRRQREVVMTAQGKLGRYLKLLAPSLVDRMARAALNDDAKPKA
jgi:short-subunit dehydrogenase